MEKFFAKFQFGFRKGYNNRLLAKAFDKNKPCGALLTSIIDKTFYCLPDQLVIAKLHVFDFSLSFLQHVPSYLFNRNQRTKISDS